MSIARFYNRTLRRQLKSFAAWPPVTNDLSVGDFGLMRGGVFSKIGNIKADFGVDYEVELAPASSFKYESSSVTKVRIQGEAEVPVFEAVDVDAKLGITIDSDRSLSVNIAKMTASTMKSPFAAARALKGHNDWKLRYRVISRVYTAENPAVFVALKGGTEIGLRGKAKILKQIDEGLIEASGEVGVDVSTEKTYTLPSNDALQAVGAFAIDLFRVRLSGTVSPIRGEALEDDDLIDGSEEWPSTDDDSDLPELPAGDD